MEYTGSSPCGLVDAGICLGQDNGECIDQGQRDECLECKRSKYFAAIIIQLVGECNNRLEHPDNGQSKVEGRAFIGQINAQLIRNYNE